MAKQGSPALNLPPGYQRVYLEEERLRFEERPADAFLRTAQGRPQLMFAQHAEEPPSAEAGTLGQCTPPLLAATPQDYTLRCAAETQLSRSTTALGALPALRPKP